MQHAEQAPPTIAHVPADSTLEIEPKVVFWLGEWFRFGAHVPERLAADDRSVEASEPTLRREHLDIAIEVLSEDQRASYGLSPGDDGAPELCVCVATWYPDRAGGSDDPLRNGGSVRDALITARELAEAEDSAAHPLEWFRERRDLLAASAW